VELLELFINTGTWSLKTDQLTHIFDKNYTMYDIIIIGGGIVGLATGVKILQSRPDLRIAILEKENELAIHQTANNSGVIHSGLYYKPGSLKATNCINGYHELIQFCREEDIPFEITGKVVVATRKHQ